MSDTTLPHERLPHLFQWISEQQAAGRSEEDIAAELKSIDAFMLEVAVKEAVERGEDEAEVRAFFAQMGEFGDDAPEDSVDSSDPDYVEEG